MSNELTTTGAVSLVDIRRDKERFPRLCSMPVKESVAKVSEIVAKAFMYRGQQADPVNISFISMNLVEELLQERVYGARFITIEEISRAVKKAILGGSEMMGINVASLYKVVMEYVKGEGHLADKEAKEKRQDSQTNPMVLAYSGKLLRNSKIK